MSNFCLKILWSEFQNFQFVRRDHSLLCVFVPYLTYFLHSYFTHSLTTLSIDISNVYDAHWRDRAHSHTNWYDTYILNINHLWCYSIYVCLLHTPFVQPTVRCFIDVIAIVAIVVVVIGGNKKILVVKHIATNSSHYDRARVSMKWQ